MRVMAPDLSASEGKAGPRVSRHVDVREHGAGGNRLIDKLESRAKEGGIWRRLTLINWLLTLGVMTLAASLSGCIFSQTAVTSELVREFKVGNTRESIERLIAFNGELYFIGDDDINRKQL